MKVNKKRGISPTEYEMRIGAAKYIGLTAAYLMMVLMLKWPEITVEAARNAIYQWYHSIVPALLPFMMLMPLLTSGEAAYIYEKMLGKIMNLMLGLSGSAAPAIVTAMVAGSPAGAIAAARIAEETGMSKKELLRIAGCVCGLSPSFLIAGIGLGMMGDANTGILLLKTQVLTQTVMLLTTRKYVGGEKIIGDANREATATYPVMAVMTVVCYMVFYSVLAGFVNRISGNGILRYIICILEVTAGAAVIVNANLNSDFRMLVLAFICGFGGLSIFAQNMKILVRYGIKGGQYIRWRAVSGVLSCVFMSVQLNAFNIKWDFTKIKWLETTTISVIMLIIPIIFVLNNRFLNKRNF